MDVSFWRGKRVFVTGHTGFKGSWLCLLLERLGANVYGYSLGPPTIPSLFVLANVEERICSFEGDVRRFKELRAAVRGSAPEVVIHLAAQPTVRQSYADPVTTYATNVIGTVNLLASVREAPSVRAVVVVTSDKCYRNDGTGAGFAEGDALGGHDPYSNSKACAELVTEAFRASYFCVPSDAGQGGQSPFSPKAPKKGTVPCAIATARAGNVIGGGDWAADRLIPDAIRSWCDGRPITIRYPAAVRPWQHVLEPLDGYLSLAEALCRDGHEFTEAWNFGPRPDDAKPVHAVIDRVAALWGEEASWNVSADDHPHEASCLRLDCTKAESRLGWRPRTDLDLALVWTVDWYKRWAAGGDARELCGEQIDRFLTQESGEQWTRPLAAFAKAG
jgi:CDP-glucose 4,6-dehydratase